MTGSRSDRQVYAACRRRAEDFRAVAGLVVLGIGIAGPIGISCIEHIEQIGIDDTGLVHAEIELHLGNGRTCFRSHCAINRPRVVTKKRQCVLNRSDNICRIIRIGHGPVDGGTIGQIGIGECGANGDVQNQRQALAGFQGQLRVVTHGFATDDGAFPWRAGSDKAERLWGCNVSQIDRAIPISATQIGDFNTGGAQAATCAEFRHILGDGKFGLTWQGGRACALVNFNVAHSTGYFIG